MTADFLIAPGKFEFNGNFVKADVFSKYGWQARTINPPLSTFKFFETMNALPFAYYLDNRQLDGSHVRLKEISFNYEKMQKAKLINVDEYEKMSRLDQYTMEIAVTSVSIKYNIGDDEAEEKFAISNYNIAIPFTDVSAFIFPYWEDLIKEWDKQLLKEVEQLNLFDMADQAKDQIREAKIMAIGVGVRGDVNLEDYEFSVEDLKSKSGRMLNGDALKQRQLKLINEGKARYIGDSNDGPASS